MLQFNGQVAIITGSGRGLGAAYARILAARGASVVVHDAGVALDGTGSNPQVADAVVHDITTAGRIAIPCYDNIESREGCQRLIELALSQFGRLDILINNASQQRSFLSSPVEDEHRNRFWRYNSHTRRHSRAVEYYSRSINLLFS